MNNANWILKNGTQTIPCTSFPFAYRTMFNLVRPAEGKAPVNSNDLSIKGPANLKGERTTYTYAMATKLAKEQGLLTPDGTINSREFKRR